MLLTLAALALVISAAAMAALWLWQHRSGSAPISAVWPALVGALAILHATQGGGAWARRSAIAWMMGSWGLRLAIQGLYTRAATRGGIGEAARPFWVFPALAAAAVVASTPALIAALNPDPELSLVELAACVVWVVGFTGETTADRQRLRFASKPEHIGVACRSGLWRFSPRVDRIFEGMIWIAYVTFGLASI